MTTIQYLLSMRPEKDLPPKLVGKEYKFVFFPSMDLPDSGTFKSRQSATLSLAMSPLCGCISHPWTPTM